MKLLHPLKLGETNYKVGSRDGFSAEMTITIMNYEEVDIAHSLQIAFARAMPLLLLFFAVSSVSSVRMIFRGG